MKVYVLCGLILLFLSVHLYAQPWEYDFGDSTGSHTYGISLSFLPAPIDGSVRVRVGTEGGSFNLDNPGLPSLGSESELRIVAPTAFAVNKFSLYNYPAGKTGYVKFDFVLGNSTGGYANSGQFFFFLGDGVSFYDSSQFSDNQTFTGLRWSFDTNGRIYTYYRNSNGNVWTSLQYQSPFSQGVVYSVEIFANNGTSTETYLKAGVSQTISANKQDIWINNSLAFDELSKALLPNDSVMDSFMFYGISSTGNVANCFLDDIAYSNSLPSESPVPVELTNFTIFQTGNKVRVQWVSQSETGLLGYRVYRSDLEELSSAQMVGSLISATNTSQTQTYAFDDEELYERGRYYYWLESAELDGSSEFHGPIYMDFQPTDNSGDPPIPLNTGIAVYPNPFNPECTIEYSLADATPVSFSIFNLRGELVWHAEPLSMNAGSHSFTWRGRDERGRPLPSGVYFLDMSTGQGLHKKKLVLQK